MKHTFLRPALLHTLLGVLAMSVVAASSAVAQDISPKSYDPLAARALPGRVIVKLTSEGARRGIDAARLAGLRPALGIYRSRAWIEPALLSWRAARPDGIDGASAEPDALSRIVVVEYSSLVSPQDASAALSAVDGVEYAEPVYPRRLHYSPNDPGVTQQWYLDVIGARYAWDDVRADSSIVVAVVDAGIDAGHEDLAAAMWRNGGESGIVDGVDRRTNGVDDDGNGYVDDWQGWDFAGIDGRTPDNNPDPARESHGTEMSGIIGAVGDNARGTVGVAFGAKLMSLKITNEPASTFESPELFNTHEAILYAAKMGADVINCSWGDLGRMRSEQEIIDAAIEQYGAVIVASAGNSSNDNLFFPASYDGVLSVGAVESGDAKAGFSNYGYRVDISAPGTHIYAPELSNGYVYGQGTSHAAAIVSGAAALARRHFPSLSPSQIGELLRATSDDNSLALGDLAGKLGAGRLNVFNALLDGATMNSARMIDYTVVDAGGDGIVDAGESVTLRVDVRNFLSPVTSAVATLESVGPVVTIEGAEVELGALGTGQTATTPEGTFRFTTPADAAPNSTITFKVTVRTALRSNDAYIVLRVSPSFMTTDLNRISATFNGSGNIAYHGTDRRLGDGFRAAGGKELIYHAGLMIGTSATRLSDVVRVGPMSSGTAEGLQTIQPYRVRTDEAGTRQEGIARFDDAHRSVASRVGVDVRMRTLEWSSPEDLDYVLVEYAMTNTSGAPLTNLHAGLYIDWDLAPLGEGDVAALDEDRRLGYVTNEVMPQLVVGAALLGADEPLAFSAVDNSALRVSSQFTAEQKWQLLGNGIGTRTTEPTDVGIVIGAGPLSLAAGATRRVAFMLGASESLELLRGAASRAGARYLATIAVPGEADALDSRIVARTTPNPTYGTTHLELTLPEPSSVTVRVVDATGRVMLSPFDGALRAGSHRIAIDAGALADGVYFFEVIAAGHIARGRFVRLEGTAR